MYEKKDLFFTSNDFSSFADVVYSDRVSLNLPVKNNTQLIEKSYNPNFLCYTYKMLEFEIKSGSTVFCNTDLLDNLFYHLKKNKTLKNINLITHQTDQIISEALFKRKPNCVNKWFAVNAGFNHKDLIPIPIGIASDFSLKNLIYKDFTNFNNKNYLKKDINLYINFNKNTNFRERKDLINLFKDKSWVTIDNPDLSKQEYLKNLQNYTFVLCPWGNGVDTHRLWETIYSGSIPVTKYHETYKAAKNLPVLFVKNYEEINKELLTNYIENFESLSLEFEKLTKNYWKQVVKGHPDGESIHFNENLLVTRYFDLKRYTKKLIKKTTKRFSTLFNKIVNRLRFQSSPSSQW